MYIKSLRLKNFMCFSGELTFEFLDGVNIIAGDNGYGKSKVFDAIQWVLFDRCYDTNSKTFLSSSKLGSKIISDKAISNAFEDEAVDVESELIVVHESNSLPTEYKFTRRLSGIKGPGNNVNISSSSIITLEEIKNGGYSDFYEDDIYIKNIIQKVIPSHIREYLWFQGEAIDHLIDFNNETSITKAINVLSELETFKVMENNAKKVKEYFQQDYEKRIRQKSKNSQNVESLYKKRTSINEQLQNIDETIQSYKEQKHIAESRIDELTFTLEEISDLESYNSQLKTVTNELGDLNLDQNKTQVMFYRNLFENNWVLKNIWGQIHEIKDYFTKYEEDRRVKREELIRIKASEDTNFKKIGNLPLNTPSEHELQSMLKQCKCELCGNKFELNDESYQTIKLRLEYLNTQPKKDITENDLNRNNFSNEIKSIKEILLYKLSELQAIQSDVRNLTKKELETTNKINKLLEKEAFLSNQVSEIAKQYNIHKDDISNIGFTIRTKRNNISNFEITISSKQREYDNLLKELEDIDIEVKKLEKRYSDINKYKVRISDFLFRVCQITKDRVYNELIDRLVSEANTHYKKMTIDNKSARGIIHLSQRNNNTIKPSIIDSDNNEMFGLNTGNTVLVKMAIMMAIITASSKTRFGSNYPLISDAPLSTLGFNYALGFIKAVGEVYNQVIITSKEFYSNHEIRKKVLEDKSFNVNKIYILEPNLLETNRNNRKDLETKVEEYK